MVPSANLNCGTCGRENPSHLTFCQDCGARLAPRIVPPTPPVGISRNGLPLSPEPPPEPPAAAPDVRPSDPRSPGLLYELPKRRPSVPEFQFGPRDMAALEPEAAICPNCSSSNRGGSRFCMTCGQVIGAPSRDSGDGGPIAPTPMVAIGIAPPALALEKPSPEPSPAAPSPAAPSPAPGVALPGPPSPEVKLRPCSRCRGACDASAAFCKFCGASLGETPAEPHAAAPATDSPPKAAGLTPAPGLMSGGASRPATAPRPALEARPASNPKVPVAQAPIKTEAMVRGRLVIIAKDGGEGQAYPIREGLDIGRSEGDVVLSDDRYLSPRHARLIWHREELILRDLGSVNGVFLRLSKSQSPNMVQALRDQDLILIGQQVIRFEIVKDAEEGLGPATQHGTLLFGTPAAPRHARLCQRTVEGVTRDVFHVRKVETVLGRESGDIVFTEDPFLSRRHAVIKLDPMRKTFTLADLGSSNGTFLQLRGDAVLKSGDEFRVGQQLFRVTLDANVGSQPRSGAAGAGSPPKSGAAGAGRMPGIES